MTVLVAEQRVESLRDKARVIGPYQLAGELKYGEAFWRAELIKTDMRRKWARPMKPNITWDEYRPRAIAFWQEYEEINRIWLPEDPVYTGTRAGVALSTTADLWTLTVGTAGQQRVLESYIAGEAVASAVARVGIARSSTNGVTPTNQTPEKMNSRSPAAVGTFATTWTTQPVRSTNSVVLHAFNAFGGSDRWVPQPGEELYLVGTGTSEQISCRSLSGTSTVSAHCIFEEL